MEIVWLEQMMKCPRSLTQFGQLRVARALRVIAKEQWDPHAQWHQAGDLAETGC